MDINTKTRHLRECALFSGLDDEELQKVLNIVKVKRYQKNIIIFSEDEIARGFFTVAKGKVKIYKVSGDGRQHIFHIITKGGVFAEAAVFSGEVYPAFAETLTVSELFYFRKEDFYSLIKENPQISLNMLATLSKYLRRFSNLVEEISLKDVSSRLAKYILNQSNRFSGNSFELTIKKRELASQLGTIGETLSRSFNRLKSKKIIDVKGKYIYILDKVMLSALSRGEKIL
jgi:CRP/FNR family transcriptional regulator